MGVSRSFPEKGLPAADVQDRIKRYREGGADWHGGRVPIFVFHADDEVLSVSKDAFIAFFSENAQGLAAFPAVGEMQDEVTAAALALLNAPEDGDAILTSGGTESIFIAVQCARDHARAAGRGTANANIVMPWSGHPAFDKAARYLDLQIRRAPIAADFTADVDALAALVDEDTVMIVASAPSFPHGVFDPIADIGRLAQSRDVWMHVDACVGGYLAPFARRLGYPVPDFDFRIPAVHSISADLHKYGFAAKPASTVLFRDKQLSRHALFEFDAWPRGHYRSRCFTGSRPAGAVASAWAVLNYLGAEGYMRHARTIMETRDALMVGIESIPGLHVQGNPALGLISFGSDTMDIHAVGDELEERGWFVPRNAVPAGIQFMTMPVHARVIDDYLADLAEAARAAGRGSKARSTAQVIY